MPAGYEKMRDKFKRQGMSDKAAKGKAARIWNAKHPGNPVTRKHHIPGGSMHELVEINEGAADRVIVPGNSDAHSGAVTPVLEKRDERELGYGAVESQSKTPLEETQEHMDVSQRGHKEGSA